MVESSRAFKVFFKSKAVRRLLCLTRGWKRRRGLANDGVRGLECRERLTPRLDWTTKRRLSRSCQKCWRRVLKIPPAAVGASCQRATGPQKRGEEGGRSMLWDMDAAQTPPETKTYPIPELGMPSRTLLCSVKNHGMANQGPRFFLLDCSRQNN